MKPAFLIQGFMAAMNACLAALALPAVRAGAVPTEGMVASWIARAEETNPGLLKAKAEWRAAVGRIPQARALPNPEIQAELMGLDAFDSEKNLRLVQGFPWPGTLSRRGSAAMKEARALELKLRAASLQVAARIRASAAELGFLSRKSAILRAKLALYEKQVEYLEQRATGGGEVTDLPRVEIEAAMLEDQLAETAEMIRQEAAMLEALVGRPIDRTELERVTLPAPAPTQTDGERQRLAERIEVANPTIQALRSRVAAAREGVSLARLEAYPELMAGAGYRQVADRGMSGEPGRMDEAMVMISLSLPVWQARTSGARREAEAMLDAANAELEEARRMAFAQLETLLSKLRDAGRRAALFQDRILPRARQSLEAAEVSYRAGSVRLIDLLDIRRALLEAEIGYWRAAADSHIAQAEIDALAGGSFDQQTR